MLKIKLVKLFFVFTVIYSSMLYAEKELNDSIIINAGYHVFPDSSYFDMYDRQLKILFLNKTNNLPGINYEIELNKSISLNLDKFNIELGIDSGNYNGYLNEKYTFGNRIYGKVLDIKVFYIRFIPKVVYKISNKINTLVGIGIGNYFLNDIYKQYRFENDGSTNITFLAQFTDFNIVPHFVAGLEYSISNRLSIVIQDKYSNNPIFNENEGKTINIGGNSIMFGLK